MLFSDRLFFSTLSFQIEKGVRDVLQSDTLFDCKKPIHRSFHFAKNAGGSSSKKGKANSKRKDLGPEFIEFIEFRLFLATLRQYFEYYQAFDR